MKLIRFSRATKLIVIAATLGYVSIVSAQNQEDEKPSPEKEGKFLSNPRQLIYEGKRSGEGYFSADGKYLVFQSERENGNPFYQMYVLDLESGDTRLISPGIGKTTCGFIKPDNTEIMFSSTHLNSESKKQQQDELDFRASGKQRRYSWDYDSSMDIFTVSFDGKTTKQLTNSPGYNAEGAYSPDGKKIVFCSLRSAYPLKNLSEEDMKKYEIDPAYYGEIYIMNADGTDQKRLMNSPGYDGGPFFSPDGDRIIWRRFDKSGMNADVFTMKTDGSDVRRITDFKAMSWAPYFHPSQKYIVFTTNKHGFGNFELFIVDSEGKHDPVRVTYTPRFDGLPVFSPDGKKLAWSASRTEDGNSQIFFADWNHEEALKALNESPLRSISAEPTSSTLQN